MSAVGTDQMALALALIRHRSKRAGEEASYLAASCSSSAPTGLLCRQPALVRWMEARRNQGCAGYDPGALVASGVALIDEELGLRSAPPIRRLQGGADTLCKVLERVLSAEAAEGSASLALGRRLCDAATRPTTVSRPAAWLDATYHLLVTLALARGEAALGVLASSIEALVMSARAQSLSLASDDATRMHVASLNAQGVFAALATALEAAAATGSLPAGEWSQSVHRASDSCIDLQAFPVLALATWQIDALARSPGGGGEGEQW